MDKIQRAIQDIGHGISVSPDMPYGLLTGIAGITLFHAHTAEHFTDTDASECLQETFDLAFEKFSSAAHTDTSFGYGSSGYLWQLQELGRLGLMEQDDAWNDIISFTRRRIAASVVADTERHDIDFLTGATGKMSALFPLSADEIMVAGKFIDYLSDHIVNNSGGLFSLHYRDGYAASRSSAIPYVNTGLAHGVPGIVQFCTLSKKNGLFTDKAGAIAAACFDFLLRNVNEDTTACYFPPFITRQPDQPTEQSRLAWCYGDLSLAYILLLAGNAFQNTAIGDLALQMLHHGASRRAPGETYIADAGVCHGSAGVAHLFHKAWLATKAPALYDAAGYWVDQTLAFAIKEEGKTVYKRFDAARNSSHTEYNLLGGMAGIGLVLHSWLTGDCSWDACLMLQDLSA